MWSSQQNHSIIKSLTMYLASGLLHNTHWILVMNWRGIDSSYFFSHTAKLRPVEWCDFFEDNN